MELQAGDILQRNIEVLKAKSGTATKVKINGSEYALVPQDYINGNKNKFVSDKSEKEQNE